MALVTTDPFTGYSVEGIFDEMLDARAQPRRSYRRLHKELLRLTPEELWRSKQQADLSFFNQGITFTVYGRQEGTERIFPHDLLPRIISGADWDTIERGLTQRLTALNLFLHDIYHERRILADGIVPREVIYSCRHYPPPDDGRQGAARRLRQRRWAPIWSGCRTASSSCSKTTCACRAACRTCSRTARS